MHPKPTHPHKHMHNRFYLFFYFLLPSSSTMADTTHPAANDDELVDYDEENEQEEAGKVGGRVGVSMGSSPTAHAALVMSCHVMSCQR